jgi:CHAT domain-containing protein
MCADPGAAKPPRGLSDEQLDELLVRSQAAERENRIGDAQALLAIVLSELIATGHWVLWLFERMAKLQAELGDHAEAARWLDIGRDWAVQESHPTAIFHMDLALARNAIAANRIEDAEIVLTRMPAAVGAPPPLRGSPERAPTWLANLRIDAEPASASLLRAAAGFTVIELWRARARYRSALALVAPTRAAVGLAGVRSLFAEVDLLEAELLFAAGENDAAWECVNTIGGDASGRTAVRRSIVALRIAVRGGRLAAARELAVQLAPPLPVGPTFVGLAAAGRAAMLNELNLHEQAHDEVASAMEAIHSQSPINPVMALLERSAAATAFRARIAVASWELPWLPEQAWRVPTELGDDAADLELITSGRDCEPWVPLLDAILVALEAEDLVAARGHLKRLVVATSGIESKYVAARVHVAEALVRYYDGGPTQGSLQRLVDAASALGATGARLAELQALRFAAWSAGRLGREVEHRELAARAIAVTDAIAGELRPDDRAAFLMNKWSGRDDLVMLRVDHTLRSAPPRGRPRSRALCALFGEIERLASWPVEDALSSPRARGMGRDDTPDQVARWIADSRMAESATSFALRSTWSLWRIRPGTVALHYHVLPDRIVLFRIAWRRIEAFILPVSRANLDQELARCLADLQDDRDPAGVDATLSWLARALGVADAVATFPRARRLIAVAHDVLANVPFPALPVEGGALCTRVTVSQLDRLSRLGRKARRSVGRLVGLGVSRHEPAMPDLPGAESEIEAIAELIGRKRATSRLGQEATRGALADALGGATHVHVATHGHFDIEDPAGSGVVMHDGPFQLRDLHAVRPQDLRVVALPTCWSAEIAMLPGRARICLPTALLDAGARSVIASLWEVGDRSGSALMMDAYRRMRRVGPATALSAAQATRALAGELRRNWAGFVCYGSD